MRFPKRATGGWWWIWRWRFEFLAGWLEYDSRRLCEQVIRPGMTVIDIGAHIGYYTRLFSRWVGPHGTVIAFEPHPENFAVLAENVRGLRNVEIHAVAISDRDGSTSCFVAAGHSNHSLVADFAGNNERIEVRTTTVDRFLATRGRPRVDFIKSDTEGAEPLVLSGMADTVSRSPGLALLMEYYPAALRAGGVEPASLLSALDRAGFSVDGIFADGLRPMSPGLDVELLNIYARRAQPEPGNGKSPGDWVAPRRSTRGADKPTPARARPLRGLPPGHPLSQHWPCEACG